MGPQQWYCSRGPGPCNLIYINVPFSGRFFLAFNIDINCVVCCCNVRYTARNIQFSSPYNRITRNQARSQDLEKREGGFFERVRKVQTTLTRIFIVLESVSHGLCENWDEISRKAQKFKGFFRPKSGGLQNKKVFTEIETDFSAEIGNSNVWGGAVFLWGGYFQFFTKNRPQMHQKRAILHTSQAIGGARAPPPPPGYATARNHQKSFNLSAEDSYFKILGDIPKHNSCENKNWSKNENWSTNK